MNDGNEAQSRVIAKQLFDVWSTEQAEIAKENRRWFGNNISGWVSATVVVLGTLIAGVTTLNKAVEANERSLRNEASIAVIKADMSDRLARIETKLDLIISERAQRERGAPR